MLLVLLCLFAATSFSVGSVYAADFFTVKAGERVYRFNRAEFTLTSDGYALNDIDEVIERIYLDTLVLPENARLLFTPEKDAPFRIFPSKKGRAVNKKRLKAEIQFALDAGKSEVAAPYRVLEPTTTEDYLKNETQTKAFFSTYYGSSSTERKHNVELACKSLNGLIIDSGGVFSFNETVGARTQERGFKSARVIIDGKYTSGTGGGVCQVSTTLYNAALRAGVKIEECHAHSLSVGYVPPSFDAMVSDSGSDLRFTNDSGRRLYLRAVCDGENIAVTIFGVKNEYVYDFRSEITEVIAAKSRGVKSNGGEEPVCAKDGLKSSAFVTIYKDGKIVSSYCFRNDYYAPIDGVYYID